MAPTRRWPSPIPYAGGHLDRAGERRHDDAWVASMRAHPEARLTPVWRGRSLVRGAEGTEPHAVLLAAADWSALAPDDAEPWTLLGVDARGPVFTADASALDERAAAGADDAAFVDLHKVGALLHVEDASTLAYAKAMVFWHRRSRFCGVCGAPTESRLAGHMRKCTDPACATETYPRTDPAVIMLVELAEPGAPRRCLLGRRPGATNRMWSTLAGFMEPGETLEETVAREVREEAGVRVAEVVYQGSQPWPFPASLMVGFRAVAASSEITVDPHELAEARWFAADELATFGETGDANAERWLPGRSSIARALIEGWLGEARGA